jgi:hypothetical protein
MSLVGSVAIDRPNRIYRAELVVFDRLNISYLRVLFTDNWSYHNYFSEITPSTGRIKLLSEKIRHLIGLLCQEKGLKVGYSGISVFITLYRYYLFDQRFLGVLKWCMNPGFLPVSTENALESAIIVRKKVRQKGEKHFSGSYEDNFLRKPTL